MPLIISSDMAIAPWWPANVVDVKYFDRDILASSDAKDFSIKPFKGPFKSSQIGDMINRISKKCFYKPQILIDDRKVNKSTYGSNKHTPGGRER
jgi:hypothetical protein